MSNVVVNFIYWEFKKKTFFPRCYHAIIDVYYILYLYFFLYFYQW